MKNRLLQQFLIPLIALISLIYAIQALGKKVFQEDVIVESSGYDRYDRLLGRIWLGDRDINREMVREGHAWAYRQYLTDQSFLEDEAAAKTERIGLWSVPDPVAPWAWRRGSRSPAVPVKDFTCGVKTYCREMASCAEAKFYLQQCGLSRLDGDGDGIPCESVVLLLTGALGVAESGWDTILRFES